MKIADIWEPFSMIVVIVGGYLLFMYALEHYNDQVEERTDEKLEAVCGVITNEQPNNTDLFDRCMDAGYAEFE